MKLAMRQHLCPHQLCTSMEDSPLFVSVFKATICDWPIVTQNAY